MAERRERIFNAHWEGPFKWGEHEDKLDESHVLYAIYGNHPVYGLNVLLYIGMTEHIGDRMHCHAQWVEEEYDVVSVRIASMGEISSWDGWDDTDRYDAADPVDVKKVEALLIFAHQPAYNQLNKGAIASSGGVRIFNTGRIGSLLPEVSYRYYNEDGEW